MSRNSVAEFFEPKTRIEQIDAQLENATRMHNIEKVNHTNLYNGVIGRLSLERARLNEAMYTKQFDERKFGMFGGAMYVDVPAGHPLEKVGDFIEIEDEPFNQDLFITKGVKYTERLSIIETELTLNPTKTYIKTSLNKFSRDQEDLFKWLTEQVRKIGSGELSIVPMRYHVIPSSTLSNASSSDSSQSEHANSNSTTQGQEAPAQAESESTMQ